MNQHHPQHMPIRDDSSPSLVLPPIPFQRSTAAAPPRMTPSAGTVTLDAPQQSASPAATLAAPTAAAAAYTPHGTDVDTVMRALVIDQPTAQSLHVHEPLVAPAPQTGGLEPALPFVLQRREAPAPAPARPYTPAPLPGHVPDMAGTPAAPPMHASPVFGTQLAATSQPLTPWTDAAPVTQQHAAPAPAPQPAPSVPLHAPMLPADVAAATQQPAAGWFPGAPQATALPAETPQAMHAPQAHVPAEAPLIWSGAPGMTANALVPSSAMEKSPFAGVDLAGPALAQPVALEPLGAGVPRPGQFAASLAPARPNASTWLRRALWVLVPALAGVALALGINHVLG